VVAVVDHVATVVSPVVLIGRIVIPARKIAVVVLSHAGERSVGDWMWYGHVEIDAIGKDC
jgi:hypothetical protein